MPIPTKEIFAEALEKLILTKDIDQITVKDLIGQCPLSRSAFYYHFQDLDALIQWILQKDVDQIVKESSAASTSREALLPYVNYVVKRQKVLRRALNSPRRGAIEKLMFDGTRRFLTGLPPQILPFCTRQSSEDKEFLVNFYACAVTGLWILNADTPSLDAEALIDRLERLILRCK